MLLTGVVLAMYGVMGVSFFNTDERFKAFDVAIFSLFQASTGDGWSDIVRDLYEHVGGEVVINAGITLYFISFMLIVSLILMQVVIAVLLEEFSKVSDAENRTQDSAALQKFSLRPNPFEAFVDDLQICRDGDSQTFKILQVWKRITDTENMAEDASLSFTQVARGLKSLRLRPPALLSKSDWNDFVVDTGLCDSDGKIDKRAFVLMVKRASQTHLVGELTKSMGIQGWEERSIAAVLFTLKTLLIEWIVENPPKRTSVREGNSPTDAANDMKLFLDAHNQLLQELRSIGSRVSEIEKKSSEVHDRLGARLSDIEKNVSEGHNRLQAQGKDLLNMMSQIITERPTSCIILENPDDNGPKTQEDPDRQQFVTSLPSISAQPAEPTAPTVWKQPLHEQPTTTIKPPSPDPLVEVAERDSGIMGLLKLEIEKKDQALEKVNSDINRIRTEFEDKETKTRSHYDSLLAQREEALTHANEKIEVRK